MADNIFSIPTIEDIRLALTGVDNYDQNSDYSYQINLNNNQLELKLSNDNK